MFGKVLFATTATPACDNAAHVAFNIAEKYNSELLLFHVMGLPSRGFSPFVKDARTGEEEYYDQDYIQWVEEELKNTYAKQLDRYPNARIVTTAGIPHTEILRLARKEDVDFIVMGAHSRHEKIGAMGFRQAGSNMQRVARSARCPVLIVNRPCTTCIWYFSNIIFGTDFSKASYSAFLFASKLARDIGSRLYIFHALDLSSMHAGKIFSQEEIEEQIKAAKEKIRRIYLSQMQDYDNVEMEIWEGVPYMEILKYCREKNGDLIVMAHHTREIDPEEALLGSTVEQVALRASCPVASVNRPDKI
jgi:nucleotide-binding universal stress UspA family protein